MHNLTVSKVCLVAEAVKVGLVGVVVGVNVLVGEEVAVAGSSVTVGVASIVSVGVDVDVSGGGVEKVLHANISRRMNPMPMGIAYLRSADASIALVL